MTLSASLILGVVAAVFAITTVGGSGPRPVTEIVVGMVGTVIGGWLFDTFGTVRAPGYDLVGLMVAGVGSVLALAMYQDACRSVPLRPPGRIPAGGYAGHPQAGRIVTPPTSG